VIDQRVIARHLGLELGDDGAAGRDGHRLNALEWLRQNTAERIDLVEDFADHVE
jgi:hypothetical protein